MGLTESRYIVNTWYIVFFLIHNYELSEENSQIQNCVCMSAYVLHSSMYLCVYTHVQTFRGQQYELDDFFYDLPTYCM